MSIGHGRPRRRAPGARAAAAHAGRSVLEGAINTNTNIINSNSSNATKNSSNYDY